MNLKEHWYFYGKPQIDEELVCPQCGNSNPSVFHHYEDKNHSRDVCKSCKAQDAEQQRLLEENAFYGYDI